MQIAPPHPEEKRRLAALRALEVLDSPAEAAFDALVAAAATGCGTEIALISLVDEHRQWFKAAHGFGTLTQTPRDEALCAHAILGEGIMEVRDARLDPRFAGNPLVTGPPYIRLYAGVPLRLSGGEPVGTLCVISRRAGTLQPAQRDLLQQLGIAAAHALEATRALRSERRSAALLADTRDGVVSLDATGRIRYSNAAACRITGREEAELAGQPLTALGLGAQALRAAVTGTDPVGRIVCETTLTRPDGLAVPVTVTQTPHMTASGMPDGWTLYLRDQRGEVASRQMARDIERLSLVAQRTSNAVIITDTRGRVTWVNEGFVRITGFRLDEAMGRSPGHLLQCPETDPKELLRLRKALDSRQPFQGELLNRSKDGRHYWIALEIQPMREPDGKLSGFMAIESDITRRKAIELALRLERERLHQIMEGTAVATWRWNVETGETEFDERGAAMVGESLRALSPTTIATWSERVHPDDLSQAMVALERHLNGETTMYEAEMRIRHRDGHWVWILARGKVSERSPDGRPIWIAGTQQDVHKSKLAQLERQTVSERFRLAAESAGIGVWEIQLPTMDTQWDEQMRLLHGAAGSMTSDGIKSFWQRQVDPVDLKEARHRLVETFQTGKDYEAEYRVRMPDGNIRVLRNMARMLGNLQRNGEARLVGICQDVTEQRRQESLLQASRTFLDNAGRIAGLGGWSLDVESNTLEWSAHTCRIHGVPEGYRPSVEEALAVFPPAQREQLSSAIRRCIVEGTAFDLELPMTATGQHQRWIRMVGEAQRTDQRTIQIIGALQDVTSWIDLREALRQRSGQLQAILQHLPCGLSVIDTHRDLTAWNAEFKRLMGFPQALFDEGITRLEEFIRYNADRGEYGDGDTQDALERGMQSLEAVMEGLVIERQRPDGSWVEIRSGPMPDGGRVITYMDISARKHAQEQAEKSERILRESIEALNEAFALYDPQDRLVYCNEKYRQVYAYSADLLRPGVAFTDVIRHGAENGQYPEAAGRVEAWIEERMQTRRQSSSDLIQPLADGRILRIAERRTPDGYTVGFRIDITELVQAREVALSASRSKSQFLATMSHEIRTPMNAILGMLALLGQTPLSSRQADYAGKAEGAARSLLGLINDILDYSKIEAGKLELDPQPMRPEDLLRNLSTLLSVSVGDKPVELVYEIDHALPPVVVADELRLQQVLLNLCSNAVKFTSAGTVVLSLHCVWRDQQHVGLRVCVRDTGIGIAAEHQTRIFEGFTQAEASTARRFGGSGLGLAITRHLLSLMGSDIHLHSETGHGSTFSFELKLEVPAPTVETPATHTHLEDCPLLLIEDHPASADAVEAAARAWGWSLRRARHGREALKLMEDPRQDTGPAVRIVLLDWSVPDMAPGELLHCLRGQPSCQGARVLVLAQARDRNDIAAATASGEGPDAILAKPFTPRALREAIEGMARTATSQRASRDHALQAPVAPRPLAGLRLLVAEDNLLNQQIAQELLVSQGAQVTLAEDGHQAIAAFGCPADPDRFDLVLMDMQMPVMDGLTATRELLQTMGARCPPIVAMTANAMSTDREACLRAGMVDHVGKPFNIRTLAEVICRVTGHRAEPSSAPGVAGTGDARAQAVARLGGDAEFLDRLLARFAHDWPSLRARCILALSEGDAPALAQALHSIKGMTSALGMDTAAQEASVLEHELRSRDTLGTHSTTALDRVRQLMDTLDRQTGSAVPPLPAATDHTTAHESACHDAALQLRLRELRPLLLASDMAVFDIADDLTAQQQPPPQLLDMLGAIEQMAFREALQLCDALLDSLRTKPPGPLTANPGALGSDLGSGGTGSGDSLV